MKKMLKLGCLGSIVLFVVVAILGACISQPSEVGAEPEPVQSLSVLAATVTPEPQATLAPPTPTSEPEVGFGDGTYIVGESLQPGTYRSNGTSLCYWARLRGFGGVIDDIIANGNNAPEIITISAADMGFESKNCGRWVPVDMTAQDTPTEFGDGTYATHTHIEPGTYQSDGTELCYWARLSDFSQEISGIIANGNNATVITIEAGDAGFSTFRCGTWRIR